MSLVSLGLPTRLRGLCSDLPPEQKEWFFADGHEGVPLVVKAKAICKSGCPIQEECLQVALSSEVSGQRYGVFGGTSAYERERSYKSWYRQAGLCSKGLHAMSGENVLATSTGSRRCRSCKVEREVERDARRKAARAESEDDLAAAV